MYTAAPAVTAAAITAAANRTEQRHRPHPAFDCKSQVQSLEGDLGTGSADWYVRRTVVLSLGGLVQKTY